MAIIEANNLKKVYTSGETKTHALRGVSFDIENGEFVAVMGPSGSGKSTLLHIIGFLDRPTSGKYTFEGKTMDDYTDDELAKVRNKKMGFVFQSFNLLSRSTALENVKLPLIYSDIKHSERDKLAKKALEDVGLGDRMDHEPSQLSGGERQRVAIARALVNDPDVIFADEPTGNLDSESGEQVMNIINDLNEVKGHTVVLITHETYTAEYAERIISLMDGEVEDDRKVKDRNNKSKGFIK